MISNEDTIPITTIYVCIGLLGFMVLIYAFIIILLAKKNYKADDIDLQISRVIN